MPPLEPPRCPICKDARYLRGPGPMGTTVRCPVCNRAPDPVEAVEPAVRQPRRGWAERLES